MFRLAKLYPSIPGGGSSSSLERFEGFIGVNETRTKRSSAADDRGASCMSMGMGTDARTRRTIRSDLVVRERGRGDDHFDGGERPEHDHEHVEAVPYRTHLVDPAATRRRGVTV